MIYKNLSAYDKALADCNALLDNQELSATGKTWSRYIRADLLIQANQPEKANPDVKFLMSFWLYMDQLTSGKEK